MVSTSGVKLLGSFFSPFVNRVQIALNLKSIDFDYFEEILSSKSNLLLRSNPVHKKVPVLFHDGKIICESLIIVQYIDEAWTNNGYLILPSDSYDRAVSRFWAAYVDDKLVPLLKELLLAQGEKEKVAVKEQIEEVMVVLEEGFVKCSKGKNYFGGDNIGYIDIALGSCSEWINAMEKISGMKLVEKAKTPELVAWAHRFVSNDAVKNVLPDTERFIQVLKRIQARVKGFSN